MTAPTVGQDFLHKVSGRLTAGLGALGAKALVVVARSAKDIDLAPFVGPIKLAGAVLVVTPAAGERAAEVDAGAAVATGAGGGAADGGSDAEPEVERAAAAMARAQLAYLTPMERDEAAATGLALLPAERLELDRLGRPGQSAGELLGLIIAKTLQLAGLSPGRIALAGSHAAGSLVDALALLAGEGWVVVNGSDLLRQLRKRKTARQLVAVRQAGRGVQEAFYRIAELLAASEAIAGELWVGGERVTVGRLRGEAAQVFARLGMEQPEGGILAPAEEGAVPHNPGHDERVLRPSESLVVDLYPRGWAFADCTRTFCVGPAPAPLAAAHAAVRDALLLSRRLAEPGVLGWDLQVAVCEHLASAGYQTPVTHPGTTRGYVHGLGHGVGFELHELPSFAKRATLAEGTLEAGDVITLEPGIYEPELGFAVRIEDLCAIDEEGQLLDFTPLPYALDPRAWRG